MYCKEIEEIRNAGETYRIASYDLAEDTEKIGTNCIIRLGATNPSILSQKQESSRSSSAAGNIGGPALQA